MRCVETALKNYSIATVGSHSALQILKGARDEGFRTITVCIKEHSFIYRHFEVADRIIEIPSYANFESVTEELIRENAILVPHASLIAYVGTDVIEKMKVPYYGNRKILAWESNRSKQREWLKRAGLNIPKVYENPEEIDTLCIVKFHGAKGGQGYFLAKSKRDFYDKIGDAKEYFIQEYVVGTPVYIHYFYSVIRGELELMGFDRRYESNVDGITRIPAIHQEGLDVTYTIVGNLPLILRESLLPEVFKIGQRVVETSREICSPGIYGPFCLETVVTPDLKFYVFEISARIVAGTNVFMNGSPYAYLKHGKPMSTGRRIAVEIREAIEQDRLKEILG
ncbi:MAG: formate--phosphoribosylaminoimidazolecarboxamide ligase [Thermoproteota archaeon]|nr:formate--phosphoribosylaminoimidazolecarboxamide ligase [Candidatus Brockarchaeota archaeon]MBO3840715.1 formate--phosphoribosylaminoimidazolecarboxamide ligase [Candidatus Brockarchaeota archaeon]